MSKLIRLVLPKFLIAKLFYSRSGIPFGGRSVSGCEAMLPSPESYPYFAWGQVHPIVEIILGGLEDLGVARAPKSVS